MAISIRFFGRALSGPAPGSLPPTGQELRAKVEPRLAELVGAVVASLRTAGIVPVPVTDPHGRQWAPAYILGTLANSADPGSANAEAVVDGSGRLVRNHPVEVVHAGHRPVPVSCPCLAEPYEQFILGAQFAEVPRGDAMVLTRHGDLIIGVPGQEPVALAEYLERLARSATESAATHRRASSS
jgi:hypothetical protein